MTILVPITLFGWVPCVLLLFLWLPPRRAVIVAFMVGWLFLPAATFQLPGIPDYSKMAATCAGVLLAALVFDTERLLSFRPRWFDLPMIVWCLCPFGTNASENIDMWDSFSWTVNQVITWGMPYFIGRVYFTDAESIRELAIGLFISGLVYIPICLFEIRMSPQLGNWLYGFDAGYSGTRLGGWRPTGLMASGLMLGMWMTAASLCGIWLWYTGSLKRLGRYKAGTLVVALVVTTILCKSTGALVLLFGGLGLLWTIKRTRVAFPYLLLCAIPVAYPIIRAGGMWDGSQAVAWAQSTVGEDRAKSLRFRFRNEDMLSEKALKRAMWGWGRFGKSRVYDENGKDISTTDGLWIITMGMSGIVGLICVTSIFLVPGIRFWWRTTAADWSDPSFAAVAAFSVILVLYAIDNVLNAMVNPVITVAMGAVSAAALRRITPVETPLQPQAIAAQLPLRKSPSRRVLWPPQQTPVRAGSHWEAGTRGEREPSRPRRAPEGPHWRR
jgi:hypothetical protein